MDRAAYECPICLGKGHAAYVNERYDQVCPRCKGHKLVVQNFDEWYSPWMRMLAANYTKDQLLVMLQGKKKEGKCAGAVHLRAIEASTSMSSQSQRRAHARNIVAAIGEAKIAIGGALQIYDLFPEKTKEEFGRQCR